MFYVYVIEQVETGKFWWNPKDWWARRRCQEGWFTDRARIYRRKSDASSSAHQNKLEDYRLTKIPVYSHQEKVFTAKQYGLPEEMFDD